MKSTFRIHCAIVSILLLGSAPLWAAIGVVTNNFTTDPGWVGYGNTANGHNYGFSNTGTTTGSAGEIGGVFARSIPESRYGDTNATPVLTLNNSFTAKGSFWLGNITNWAAASNDSQAFIGFYDSAASSGHYSFLGIQLRESATVNDGATFRAQARFQEPNAGGNNTSLVSYNTNITHTFYLDYNPAGGTTGRVSLAIDNGTTNTFDLTTGERTDGATFNAFGIGTSSVSGLGHKNTTNDVNATARILVDSVIYTGTPGSSGGGTIVTNNFNSNPSWNANGNTTNGNNFGYSSGTSVAGGSTGEVGGTFARSSNENYYVSATFSPPLTLSNFFNASGKFDVNNSVNFDGEVGIGYFSTNKTDYSFVGLDVLESTNSSVFRVGGKITTGNNTETMSGLTIKSINGNYWYSINYTPTGGVSSLGRLTLIVTNATSGAVTSTVDVTSAMRTAGATLDAFGIGALPRSTGNSNLHIDVFMDDVIYATAGATGGGGSPTGPFYITSLTSNSTYSGVINFAVDLGALGTGGVASVEYRLGGKNQSMYWDGNRLLRPITTGPTYSTNWHTLNVWPDSSVRVDAVARDAAGNVLGTTPTIPVYFANSNSNFRVTVPTPLATISGNYTFNVSFAATAPYGELVASIDGKFMQASIISPGVGSTNRTDTIDTTKFLDGQHELNFVYAPAGDIPIAWAQFPVIFNNGHTAMELRSTWKELHLTPGETALLTTKMFYTDATTSTVTSTFASSKPSVATVSSGGLVTAITNGFCTVTASNGGKTSTTYVWVTSTHSFPHFTKDGQIVGTWTTNSIFMREFFQSDYPTPGPAGSTNLGAVMKAAAINATETGGWWEDLGTNGVADIPAWKAGVTAYYQAQKNLVVSNDMSLYLIGDGIAFAADNLMHTLLATNLPLFQYAVSNIYATGRCIGIDMVDEVNSKWGDDPTPDDGRWMSSPPSNICNNSGITFNSGTLGTEGAYVHDYKANTAWAAANGNSRDTSYALNKQITIDLGAVYEINGMRIWNDNQIRSYELQNVGVTNYTLATSPDNSTWTTRQSNQSLAAAPCTNGYAGVYTTISPTWTNVRYVRFTINDTCVSDDAIGGLSEVMFNGRTNATYFILSNETASATGNFWRKDDPTHQVDVPDYAFTNLVSSMRAVPSPQITWSCVAGASPEDVKRWTGDPNMSGYNGIYVDNMEGSSITFYPTGVSFHDYVDAFTIYHTFDAWEADAFLPEKPSFFLVGTTGAQYLKRVAGDNFTVGGDKVLAYGSHPNLMAGSILYAVSIGMDGVRMFAYDNALGRSSRSGTNLINGSWIVTGVGSPIDSPVSVDRWAALSNVFNTVQTLQPYILQAQGHAPDLGQNFVSSVRTGANGRVVMIMNLSERQEPQKVDLSPYTTGANITRYRVLGEKTTTSTFASTSSDAVTFEPEETIFWTIPPQ